MGGDPDALIAAFTAIDITYGVTGGRDVPVVVVVRRARWRRVTAAVTRAVRHVAFKRVRHVQI